MSIVDDGITTGEVSMELLGQVMTSLNHEARNSLQCIENALALIGDELAEGDPCAGDVQRIGRATQSIQMLLERVRDYLAPLALERSEVPLGVFWMEPWAEIQVTHSMPQLHVRQSADYVAQRIVSVDRRQMQRAFLGMFGALFAKKSGPVEVELTATETRDGVVVTMCLASNRRGTLQDGAVHVARWDEICLDNPFEFSLSVANAARILAGHGARLQIFRNGNQPSQFRYDITLPEELFLT